MQKFEILQQSQQQHQQVWKNSASADGGLAPRPAHAGPSTQPPISTSGIIPARVSAESPSNISPNLSEVISEVSKVYDDFWIFFPPTMS